MKTAAISSSLSCVVQRSALRNLRLEVVLEVLARVALRRVGVQIEHLDLVFMRLDPGSDFLGMVSLEVRAPPCRVLSASRENFRASILSNLYR